MKKKAKQQAREEVERQNNLKKQLQDEYDKEKLECSVCKRIIQRSCMSSHQKTATCMKKGLLLDETQKELHEQELKEKQKEKQKEYCKTYYEKQNKKTSYITTK